MAVSRQKIPVERDKRTTDLIILARSASQGSTGMPSSAMLTDIEPIGGAVYVQDLMGPDVLGGSFDFSVFIEIDADAVVGKISVIQSDLGDIGGIGSSAYGNGAFESRAAVMAGIPFFPGSVAGEKPDPEIGIRVELIDHPGDRQADFGEPAPLIPDSVLKPRCPGPVGYPHPVR
jgi:hypothetical protein